MSVRTRESLNWMQTRAKKKVLIFQIYLVVLLVGGCATVPLDQPKSHSEAITDTADTYFGKLANGWADLHGQKSGFFVAQPWGPLNAVAGTRTRITDRADQRVHREMDGGTLTVAKSDNAMSGIQSLRSGK